LIDGPVAVPQGLIPNDSNRGMFIWYSLAKMSQAYTLVANYATGAQGNFGQSALYSLVPEVGFYPPRLAPANQNIAYLVNFGTHQNLPLWTSQSDKVIERRWDQALPLTLAPDSACFQEWQTNSTSPIVCKSHTGIRPEGRQGRQTLDAAHIPHHFSSGSSDRSAR